MSVPLENQSPPGESGRTMSSPSHEAEATPALSSPVKPCVTCRRRKIRCDRLRPCSNCSKVKQLCTYEHEELLSANLVPNEAAQEDLHARLSRLEKLIETMRAHDDGSEISADKPPIVTLNSQGVPGSIGTQIFIPGSSIHLSCMFWAAMAKEVEDMTCLLDDWGCSKAADVPTASSIMEGMMHPGHDAAAFLPTLDESETILKPFFDSINPLMRVIHESYFRKELSQYRQGRFQLPTDFEALLFSILAVTTMGLADEIVEKIFSRPKSIMVDHFHLATKTALSRAQFVRSMKILTFQASLHYIVRTFPFTLLSVLSHLKREFSETEFIKWRSDWQIAGKQCTIVLKTSNSTRTES